MKLPLHTILRLAGAIAALDGRERVIRHNGEDRVTLEHYKFAGETLLRIAMNGNTLRPLVEAHNRAAQTVTYNHAALDGRVSGREALKAHSDETNAMLDLEHEVELKPVTIAELKLDDNNIPQSVLAGLAPLIKEQAP